MTPSPHFNDIWYHENGCSWLVYSAYYSSGKTNMTWTVSGFSRNQYMYIYIYCSRQWWANPNHNWDLNRDVNTSGDRIWSKHRWFKKTTIWFPILHEIFTIWFEKDLNCGKSFLHLLQMQFNVETALYWLTDIIHVLQLYEVQRVWLCVGLNYTASDINMLTSCWKSIYIFIFATDLACDLKDLGLQENGDLRFC